MTELKTFKLERKFSGIDDLYRYLLKNVKFIGEDIGVQIQKPLKVQPFCIIGKELITERNILFFAPESGFPEYLGELIVIAGAFDADVIVFFLPRLNKGNLQCFKWLQGICNEDIQFIVGEVLL